MWLSLMGLIWEYSDSKGMLVVSCRSWEIQNVVDIGGQSGMPFAYADC